MPHHVQERRRADELVGWLLYLHLPAVRRGRQRGVCICVAVAKRGVTCEGAEGGTLPRSKSDAHFLYSVVIGQRYLVVPPVRHQRHHVLVLVHLHLRHAQ
jgi:hypothetical protein